MVGLARIIHLCFGVYATGLIVYVLLGWFHTPETVQSCSWLGKYYEPVLKPIRTRIKPVVLGATSVDISPMVLLIAIMALKYLAINMLIPGF